MSLDFLGIRVNHQQFHQPGVTLLLTQSTVVSSPPPADRERGSDDARVAKSGDFSTEKVQSNFPTTGSD